MPARAELEVAHQDSAGNSLNNKLMTVTKPDGSPLGVSLYDVVTGGTPVTAPETNSVGTKNLYADYLGRVHVQYAGDATVYDSAFYPDPADMLLNAQTGLATLNGGLTIAAGGLVAKSASSTVFAAQIQGTHATASKALQVLDKDGNTVIQVYGNAIETAIGIGKNVVANPATDLVTAGGNLLFIADASPADIRQMVRLNYDTTSNNEVSALSVTTRQLVSGDSTIYGADINILRAVGSTHGMIGTRVTMATSVVPLTPLHAIAFSATNHGTTFSLPSPVRAGIAFQAGFDDQGFDYGFRYYGTGAEGTPDLFWVSGVTSGFRQAGEVFGRGRFYTNQGGVAGVVTGFGLDHTQAPAGQIWSSLWYDLGQNAVTLGGKIGTGPTYMPVLLAPAGGGVGVGEPTVANLKGTLHVKGTSAVTVARYGLKIGTPASPPSGYLAFFPGTDDNWYGLSSAGVLKQLVNLTNGIGQPKAAQASSNLTLTTSMADVPGATVTLDKVGYWLVSGSFAMQWSGALDNNAIISGQLVLTGGASSATGGAVSCCASDPVRMTPHQVWVVTVTTVAVTAKLQAQKNAGTGASTINSGDTTILAMWVGAP